MEFSILAKPSISNYELPLAMLETIGNSRMGSLPDKYHHLGVEDSNRHQSKRVQIIDLDSFLGLRSDCMVSWNMVSEVANGWGWQSQQGEGRCKSSEGWQGVGQKSGEWGRWGD